MSFLGFGRSKNVDITQVSPTTEIRIPWLGWIAMMVLGPLFVSIVWAISWLFWFYDAKQSGLRWYRWSQLWLVWWDKGGDILFVISLLFAAALATGVAFYRFYTETWAKAWDARDGLAIPGKVVPPEMRRGG